MAVIGVVTANDNIITLKAFQPKERRLIVNNDCEDSNATLLIM
jgi:hypothetical protein